jgi:hypothetical protein
MRLVSATVERFKSIDSMQEVRIEADVTVLVGMNESGKTAFLRALEKSKDALGLAKFDPIPDYPRKDLSQYLKKHPTSPDLATRLAFEVSDDELSLRVCPPFSTFPRPSRILS